MAEMMDLSLLFPKAQGRPTKLKEALNGADVSGLPLFNDKYAKLWPQIPVPQGAQLKSAAHLVIGQGFNSCIKPNPNMPCCTLPKTQTGRGFATIARWDEQRALSIGEAKRIGSFPDLYQLTGDYSTQWMRIGNSVPPLLMRAIALQIKSVVFGGQPLTPYPSTMSYLDILESAWLDHLAPRQPDAPTVISTFAGGGGSSLGYSMAGYRELLAVEWDNNAVETFRLNFPDVPVYHGDIAKLSVEECLRLAGIEPGELDVFDGSPPCQGFSTAGKRIIDDPRNQLFREYVRLLRGLRPKVFVMENVSGMVKGKMKLVFAEILRELKASGYKVSARLLNAMYFNVPQSRERMIFIGVREDLGIEPSHPKAESRPVTVREAFQDVTTGEVITPSPALAKCLPTMKPGKGGVNGLNQWFFNTKKLHWGKPANNVNKEHVGSRAGLVHPSQDRLLGLGEFQRLQSFPDRFIFLGRYKEVVPRIGNSVPPLFMKSIANHIRTKILRELLQIP